MKKILGEVSLYVSIIAIFIINLTGLVIDNSLLFFIGWVLLIIGIVGLICFNKSCKALILKLLDLF